MDIKDTKQLALHAAKRTAPAEFSLDAVDAALADAFKELAGSINEFNRNKYDIYEIIIETADEVVPNRVMDVLGTVADFKFVNQGQKIMFKKKLGKNRAKKFLTQVGVSGVYRTFRLDTATYELNAHAIGGAVTLDFERMLDGAESMADVMDILVEGLVEGVLVEVQRALRAALNATGRPDANKVTVSGFKSSEMQKLINVVKAYGQNAVIMAPPEFIAEMGPDAIVAPTANVGGVYSQADIDAIHNTGLIKIFRGCPVVEIPQSFIDENNKETYIDPQMAYVLPTGNAKVVKVGVEGPTQINDFTNRDNSMEIHAYRKIGVAIETHHNWGIYQNTGITQTMGTLYSGL